MPNPNVDRASAPQAEERKGAEEEGLRRSRDSRARDARLQLRRIPRPARGLVRCEKAKALGLSARKKKTPAGEGPS